MFADCIDRMTRSACGGCERRDACAPLWRASNNPFLAFLGDVAKAIEGRIPAQTRPPRPSAFRREVERVLEPMLGSGPVRIDEVARALGCSRQTLYRRLKAEGATFAELLDGLRHRLALRFVREEGLSVKESAYRLGFSDPAAFSRAFKRWTGASPRGQSAGRSSSRGGGLSRPVSLPSR